MHRMMVNVTTNASSPAYALDPLRGAPYVELHAFAPNASNATHAGERGSDGVVRLDFTTEQNGTWYFRVSTFRSPEIPRCHVLGQTVSDVTLQSYSLYWGCHPHCVDVGT